MGFLSWRYKSDLNWLQIHSYQLPEYYKQATMSPRMVWWPGMELSNNAGSLRSNIILVKDSFCELQPSSTVLSCLLLLLLLL